MHKTYLDELNEQQREAVTTISGPLLILAGAGAGKTKTLTHRVLHLVHNGVNPENILAITFTNKAAREMRDRIAHLIQTDSTLNTPLSETTLPKACTFHSLGAQLLRKYSDKLSVTRSFSILDRQDCLRLVKDAVIHAGYDPKDHNPNKMLARISREKGKNISLARFLEQGKKDFASLALAEIWRPYERIKTEHNALDFDDLLLITAELLHMHPDVRSECNTLWTHVHIDEYQDTNAVQNEIATLLVNDQHNICAVGDIDQNIYSWRGAQLKNILQFEKTFPDTKIITLEQNYRSTQTILTAANQIIEKNVHRKEKNLFTTNTEGEKITLTVAHTEKDEASFVAQTARDLIKDGVPSNDIAVLYRANFQSRVLEEAFLHYDTPYQVLGTRFFERSEIKDVLAFIRFARNPENITDLKRIINVPPRGIGKTTLLRIVSKKEHELTPAMQKRVNDFRALIMRIKQTSDTHTTDELIRFVIKQTGIGDRFKTEGDEGREKLENLRELVTLATKYKTLDPEEAVESLLEEASLASDQDTLDQPKDGVKLMTVHASKGLEFSYVFITGLEEGLFPHNKFDATHATAEESEEERRLFYVALTRAKKKLFLSYASVRTIFGKADINLPSEFLSDIDDALFDEASVDETPDRGDEGLLGWPSSSPQGFRRGSHDTERIIPF